MSDTIFAPHTSINMGQDGVGHVAFADDARLAVRFFKGKEIHGLESKEAGRPIYVGIDMCAIRQPGERDEWHGRATPEHQTRFPKQWEAYKNNMEYVPDGTPLDVIFPAEPDTVANLRGLKVYTVEQLAGLQEAAISRIGMGGRNLVVKAQKFMEAATGYQAANRMNKDLEDKQAKIDMLEARLAGLEKLLGENKDQPARRGPGRPPKAQEEQE